MNSPHEGTPLRELQTRFASALRAPSHDDAACVTFGTDVVVDGLPALARLRIYRNNTRAVFNDALQRTYAVVRRRVGDEFFEALAAEYRLAHPSRHGDLHWIGAEFPAWLATRLQGTGYEWLVDLARLEWACEQSLVAAEVPSIALAELGRMPPALLEQAVFALHPSLQCVESPLPIWTVWRENQPDAAGRPVDLALGAEHVLVCCVSGGLALHRVSAIEYRFFSALASGAMLGAAVEQSGLPVEQLARALDWLFEEGFVTGLLAPATEDAG